MDMSSDPQPLNPHSDAVQLVQRLFLQHINQIRGYVRVVLPDQSAVDDVVQEIFLAMTARAASYDPSRSFKSWAYGFVRNKVLQSRITRKPKSRLLGGDVLAVVMAAAPNLDSPIAANDALESCMGQLAPKARAIVDHRYRHGMQPQEIAALIDWTPGSVRVALCRARAVLRRCIEKKLAAAGGVS